MTLKGLLAGLIPAREIADVWIEGLSLDTRTLRTGDVFVALAGSNSHGLAYIEEARRKGAVAVLHDGLGPVPGIGDLPTVVVPELRSKLADLARRLWGGAVDRLDLVAVTGTNGKSSVAWLLAQALDGAMIGTLGWGRPGRHQGGSLTTPDIFSVYRQLHELAGQGVGSVVLEASSHALAQERLDGLAFSSTIFTTLGHDHLDYHVDRAAYGAAKAKLFTDFDSDRCLINLDDDFGQTLARRLAPERRVIGYSLAGHPAAQAGARLLRADVHGLHAELQLSCGRFEVRSKLIGRINLWNLLIVAAELAERGHESAAIAGILAGLEPVPGRMEAIRSANSPLAIVDYAHTPDALESALISARELTGEALWCVFGCGGDRDVEKRPRMGRVAERLADRIVLTDDNPRHENGLAIIRAIQAGMQQPQRSIVIRDRGRAIAHALQQAAADDVVLIAGKGHESDQVVGDRRLPFDDRRCVRQALEVAA